VTFAADDNEKPFRWPCFGNYLEPLYPNPPEPGDCLPVPLPYNGFTNERDFAIDRLVKRLEEQLDKYSTEELLEGSVLFVPVGP
jgi:hypothetical protein